MRDLQDSKWMYAKAGMFVFIGLVAAGLLVVENPTLKTAGLLGLAVWAFARAYYFAFYVIENYVDPSFRFSGLWSAFRYMLSVKGRR